MQNIDSDLIRGNIDTIILKTMVDGDKYGLDIIKEVETRSNGTYELKQPTLYSCLKRLENQELISSYWLDSDIGGKRHYYKLTEKGHETLRKKQEEWSKSKFIIDNLLSNFNYDEYRLVKKDDYDKIIEGKQFEYTPTETKPEEHAEPEELSEETTEPSEIEETINSEENRDETVEPEATFSEDPDEPIDESFSVSPDEDQTDDTNNDDENFEYNQTEDVQNSFQNDETEENYSPDPSDDDENQNETNLDEGEVEQIDFEVLGDDFSNSSEFDEANENEESNDDEQSDDDDLTINYSNQQIITPTEQNEDTDFDSNENAEKENNILERLRSWNHEEINEYVGDKTSYLNHVNTNSVQENLMDMVDETDNSSINQKIDEFSNTVQQLNNFSQDGNVTSDEKPEIEESQENDESLEIENGIDIYEPEENEEPASNESAFDDNFLSELSELNSSNKGAYFDSNDNVEYGSKESTQPENNPTPAENQSFDYSSYGYNNESYDYNSENNDESQADTENDEETYQDNIIDDNENRSYNTEFMNTHYEPLYPEEAEHVEQESVSNENVEDSNADQTESSYENQYNYSDFDSIISKNANDYKQENQNIEESVYEPFRPNYTGENYKQKLSNLSMYSKVTLDNKENEKLPSIEATEKSKDISALKAEFEKEGIAIKEFKRIGANDVEKNYLLVNKINMIRSLILLFGYVFVLSALYIILNNTSLKDMQGFSFKYFIYGFIPFIIYAAYFVTLYLINPYKKIPAKYAPRIMLFISVIITVQLLLITYCVNLQLGFYSFTQECYNHLIWIIPTTISFAPIISNLIYITLFYSKNFNV